MEAIVALQRGAAVEWQTFRVGHAPAPAEGEPLPRSPEELGAVELCLLQSGESGGGEAGVAPLPPGAELRRPVPQLGEVELALEAESRTRGGEARRRQRPVLEGEAAVARLGVRRRLAGLALGVLRLQVRAPAGAQGDIRGGQLIVLTIPVLLDERPAGGETVGSPQLGAGPVGDVIR